MIQNLCPGPMWVPGVVTKQLGPLTFLVTLWNGQQGKQYMDHLRRYAHGEQDAGHQQDKEADFLEKHKSAPTANMDTDGMQSEQELPVIPPEGRHPARDWHPPELSLCLLTFF